MSPPSSDLAACARLLAGGSKSFALASRVLPASARRRATALYAFCREADDAIDHASDPSNALETIRQRLDAAYAGAPHPRPADRAFAWLVRDTHLPREWPALLVEGFAWDAEGRRYPTLEALEAYALRVAGTVGWMMAWIMGVRAPRVLEAACELGIAMQFSNILRDVGEDARAGRCYLPQSWLAQAGCDEASVRAAGAMPPALRPVLDRLAAEAERRYGLAASGIAALPWSCRPAMHGARLLYRAIGRRAVRVDPLSHRAVVPAPVKLRLMVQACLAACLPDWRRLPDPRLYRINAFDPPGFAAPPHRRETPGLVWVLDLFAVLEARESARVQMS